MDTGKRQENEKKFPNWEEMPDGSRIYWFEIKGRMGWKARYIKKVDKDETHFHFIRKFSWLKFMKNTLLIKDIKN